MDRIVDAGRKGGRTGELRLLHSSGNWGRRGRTASTACSPSTGKATHWQSFMASPRRLGDSAIGADALEASGRLAHNR